MIHNGITYACNVRRVQRVIFCYSFAIGSGPTCCVCYRFRLDLLRLQFVQARPGKFFINFRLDRISPDQEKYDDPIGAKNIRFYVLLEIFTFNKNLKNRN